MAFEKLVILALALISSCLAGVTPSGSDIDRQTYDYIVVGQ